MRTATVGEIQKNFARILNKIRAGEEITIVKRGKPVAKLVGLGPKREIDWPDFYGEAIALNGQPVSEVVIEGREDRF